MITSRAEGYVAIQTWPNETQEGQAKSVVDILLDSFRLMPEDDAAMALVAAGLGDSGAVFKVTVAITVEPTEA